MRGNWNRFFSSIPLRFTLTGWAAYILTSFQGTHEAFRAVNELTHFTQYVPGHAHLGLLFFAASVDHGWRVLYHSAHPQLPDIQP